MVILFAMLASVVCLSCTNKRQQFQPEATPDKDTIVYDTPECYLGYVMDLPDEYKDNHNLPKGKYRISKSFYAKREEIKLNTEFKIK